nr:reverse transcriptase domain-containing protein [Tanacetum cinerariifolium]
MFQQTLDGSVRGWFERIPHDNINEWADLREAFAARYSVRRACFKEPHEITKIVRKANESLTTFKERWTVETSFSMGVPEVIKISSFMDEVKLPELAKRFSNKVPTTVNKMMERLDDFVRSEEAYERTKLPRGEVGEAHHKTSFVFNRRDIRSPRNARPGESRRSEYRNNYKGGRDAYLANKTRDDRALYPPPKGEYNHIVSQGREAPQPAKVIDVISVNSMKDKKRKGREVTESWMNILISFPAISSEDVFEEPLIVKAEVEGYLVRRVYVDEGSSVEVMFEHCFENLDSRIKAKLKETQTDLVGFFWRNIETIRKDRTGGMKAWVKNSSSHSFHHPLMMKFPTPKAVATLVTRTIIIAESRRLEKMVKESFEGEREVAATEEVLINPSFPDQKVTIGGGLSEACRDQLKHLLKDNIEVFSWESSNMTGVPHRIIEHTLNLNHSMDRVCQKRRTFSMEKIKMAKEDEEKTTFYTDQGTYCYNKMPFGLKNTGSTYQRNFDNLKKINIKLNPKKCSFGVEEGKLLGYIVTSEGIRANPKKTKALAVERIFRSLSGEGHHRSTDQELPQQHRNSRKLAKYVIELGAYNITYIPCNVVKGQVLADFLSKAPEGEKEELYNNVKKRSKIEI